MLSVIFFMSGAAGLVFEVVWFYRCSLAFGSSVWAASLVLSSFMAGLALGSALAGRLGQRLERPLLAYAALECAAAVAGVALTLALPTAGALVAAWTRGLGDAVWTVNAVRGTVAFALLAIPATAMGATLPLLVASRTRHGSAFRDALGRLYGWNTLGAVAGALLADVVLADRVGIVGAAVIAAAVLLCAAAMAAVLSRRGDHRRAETAAATPPGPVARMPFHLTLAAFLAGATLLALEVVWFRLLSMYVLATTMAMSAMLAVVLAAIGLGALAASAVPEDQPTPGRTFGFVAIAAGIAVVASYVAFIRITTGTQVGALSAVAWFAVVLTGPTAFLSGVLFTLVGATMREHTAAGPGADVRAAAALALANTLGAAAGPLVAAFVLLPSLGMERALCAAVTSYGAIAVLGMTDGGWGALRRPPILLAGAALAVAIWLFPFGQMRGVLFPRAAAAYAGDGAEIVATREGPAETIFLMQQQWLRRPVYSRLVTNGFSMSGTSIGAQRYMRYFAYWPMFVHDGPLRRALVICYGVGVTASAAADIAALQTIDIVELSKDIVAMSDVVYAEGGNPLRDPRVRLHLEDGRTFLQRTTGRFDLITGEPPPPRTPGAVAIYTREYFQLLRDRLADGGIATYWVPIARPNPGTDVDTIVRAFCDVFDDCSLWNATPFDLMLAGTRGARGAASITDFARPWDDARLGARLGEIGFELPQQIGATFVGDAAFARELTARTPPLVDDYPHRLRPAADRPSLSDPRYGADAEVTTRYERLLDPARARAAFAASPLVRRLFPVSLIAQTLPLFAVQRVINTTLWEGAHPLRRIEDLHAVLTGTRLRTLPLWMLGSDSVKQRIAADAGAAGGGTAIYARALAALAARDYAAAASRFLDAERAGMPSATMRPLAAYASCAAGDRSRAHDIERGFTARDPDERHFAEWFDAHCGASH